MSIYQVAPVSAPIERKATTTVPLAKSKSVNNILDHTERVKQINSIIFDLWRERKAVTVDGAPLKQYGDLQNVATKYLGYSKLGVIKQENDLELLYQAGGVEGVSDLIYHQLTAFLNEAKRLRSCFSSPKTSLRDSHMFHLLHKMDRIRNLLIVKRQENGRYPSIFLTEETRRVDLGENDMGQLTSFVFRKESIGDNSSELLLVHSKLVIDGTAKKKYDSILVNQGPKLAFLELKPDRQQKEKKEFKKEVFWYRSLDPETVPNIPKFYLAQPKPPQAYILMENYQMDAFPLSCFDPENKRKLCYEIGYQVCRTLQSLALQRCFHMDVKPENIFVNPKFTLREEYKQDEGQDTCSTVFKILGISDVNEMATLDLNQLDATKLRIIGNIFHCSIEKLALGDLAHIETAQTVTNRKLMGSFQYMPPEMIEGEYTIGEAMTVYMLAASLFCIRYDNFWQCSGNFADKDKEQGAWQNDVMKRVQIAENEADRKADYIKTANERIPDSEEQLTQDSFDELDTMLLQALHPFPEKRPTLNEMERFFFKN